MSLSIDPFEQGEQFPSKHSHWAAGYGALTTLVLGLAVEGVFLAVRAAPHQRVFNFGLQASAIALILGIGMTVLSTSLCRKRCREFGRNLTLAGAAFGVLQSLMLVVGPELGWFATTGLP